MSVEMNRVKPLIVRAMFLLLLGLGVVTGTLAEEKREIARFQIPKSVVIGDIPELRLNAVIGADLTLAHFKKEGDVNFQVQQDGIPPSPADYAASAQQMAIATIATSQRGSVGQGAAIGAVGGAVGALIQASADETQKRAAGFHEEVLRQFPNLSLRAKFMQAIKSELEKRGVTANIDRGDETDRPLRLRWSSTSTNGEEPPAVDADLYLQVSPIAYYFAPGPLNAYVPRASVGIALFEGRTRKLIAVFQLNTPRLGSGETYATYDKLLQDLDVAVPALQNVLMSLAAKTVALLAPPKAP